MTEIRSPDFEKPKEGSSPQESKGGHTDDEKTVFANIQETEALPPEDGKTVAASSKETEASSSEDDKTVAVGQIEEVTQAYAEEDIPKAEKIALGSILIYKDGKRIQTVLLHFDETIQIGRSTLGEIVLDDVNVSRKHAKIFFKDKEFYYIEDHSKGGTFVNGKRILSKTPVILRNKDKITISNFKLIIVLDDQEAQGPGKKWIALIAVLLVLSGAIYFIASGKKKEIPKAPMEEIITDEGIEMLGVITGLHLDYFIIEVDAMMAVVNELEEGMTVKVQTHLTGGGALFGKVEKIEMEGFQKGGATFFKVQVKVNVPDENTARKLSLGPVSKVFLLW